MPIEGSATAHEPRPDLTYLGLTRTATYGFLSALPLIALYEVLIILSNEGRMGEVRVSSEVWLKQLFRGIEAPMFLILGGVVVVLGIGIVLYERKKKIPIRPGFFLGMVIESGLYAVLVALLVSQLVYMLALMAPFAVGQVQEEQSMLMQIALSIGAGIYEELLFRVILVGGLYFILKTIFGFKAPAYILAAVVGALLFSAIHYMGSLGDVFTVQSFAFRFLFGLALNILYLVRGFGVAAWTHALYDIMIVTHLLG